MIASNAISQHSTDSAALDACIAAGTWQCGGVAYNPGIASSIQWSARQTGSTFTMNGVSFFSFTGCRHRLELNDAQVDESDPVYQQSIEHLGHWWEAPYAAWLAQQAHNATGRRLSFLPPDLSDDHVSPSKARALLLRRWPGRGRGRVEFDRNDRM